jgi:hypothetical protein
VERAIQVHPHHVVPLVEIDPQERAKACPAGVVHQDEQGCVELLGGAGRSLLNLAPIGDIQRCHRDRSTAGQRNLVGDAMRSVDLQVDDRDPEPICGETPCDGPSDSRACSGHEGTRRSAPAAQWLVFVDRILWSDGGIIVREER